MELENSIGNPVGDPVGDPVGNSVENPVGDPVGDHTKLFGRKIDLSWVDNIHLDLSRSFIIISVPLFLSAYHIRPGSRVEGDGPFGMENNKVVGDQDTINAVKETFAVNIITEEDLQIDAFFDVKNLKTKGGALKDSALEVISERKANEEFFTFLASDSELDSSSTTLEEEQVNEVKDSALVNAKPGPAKSRRPARSVARAKVKEEEKEQTLTGKSVRPLIVRRLRHSDITKTTQNALGNDMPNIEDSISGGPTLGGGLKAEVWETIKVHDGDRATFSLLEDVEVYGETFSVGDFIYGQVSMSGNRLLITAHVNGKTLHAYSASDGLKGIYAPELVEQEIARDTRREVVDNVSSTVNTGSVPFLRQIAVGAIRKMDPSRQGNRQRIILNARTKVIFKN